MKKSGLIIAPFFVLLLAGACGGGDGGTSGDGDGDAAGDGDGDSAGDGDGDSAGDGDGDAAASGGGDGDAPADGGAAGDGDVSTGGVSGDGDIGGGGAGGAGIGGAPSVGGSEATGGSGATGGTQNGTGGLPSICDCDAVSVPVCGADGNNYDAGCGDACVPVDIACQGVCPCEGCGCSVMESAAPCEAGERQWSCLGNEYDVQAFEELGCTSVPVGSIRYCCSATVVPEDFCQ